MPVTDDYLAYVTDQLTCLGRVESKRMFGGVGIYFKDLFFAIIAEDVLYFKVDDSNRPDYQAAGMEPFRPFEDQTTVMSYYEVPIDVLENRDRLRDWAQKALAAARAKKNRQKKHRKTS
jgi:DNA transformation protein and related proteins